MKKRYYHVILKRLDNGNVTLMTGYAMNHKQCMTYISKFTPHKHAILTIRERMLP